MRLITSLSADLQRVDEIAACLEQRMAFIPKAITNREVVLLMQWYLALETMSPLRCNQCSLPFKFIRLKIAHCSDEGR